MHKRLLMMVAAPALMTLLAGCDQLNWLHPLASGEQDLAVEPTLEGKWQEQDSKKPDTFTIRRDGDSYRIEDPNKDGPPTVMHAQLVRFGGRMYLDMTEEPSGAGGIPEHRFMKVALTGDRLEIYMLADDFVMERLKRDHALPHQRVRKSKDDTRYVVTAESWEVQNFLIRHDAEMWNEASTFHRVVEQ